ncbi:MAG: hypothetical protein M1605_01805 [Candidatus Thermoplasmatota archaeon]|nr:hypothetical protein [Candidatus Thermoplasmatota archaeon]
MVGSAFVISSNLTNRNSGTRTHSEIPMSNITLNMSISPSSVPSAAAVSGSYSFFGALIEIWPVYHPFSDGPSYNVVANISPMVTLWINSSWHSSFRLPAYFMKIENDWKEYFGRIHDGATSLIAVVSYFASNGSSYDFVYTETHAIPYNPFSVTNGSVMQSDIHPDLKSTPYFTVPSNEIPVLNTPIYGIGNTTLAGITNAGNSDGVQYTPDRLPYPGGSGYYWTWKLIGETSFINAEIPISYLNSTEKGLNTMIGNSVYMGSTYYSTKFSMAKSYDYSGTKSYSIGTSAVYASGLVSGSNMSLTVYGSNLTRYDAVLTIEGNATIWRYQWVEYGPFGNVVNTSNKYSTDLAITSLNESGDQFHISSYYAGYINLKKYNNTTFPDLSLQQRYQQAFGIYFNGSDSKELWGNPDEISYITKLDVGGAVQWNTIYTSISATTSNLEGEITSVIGLLVSLAGVGLALAAFPYGEDVDMAALFVSLVGFGVSVAALFESGVLSVTSSTFMYGGVVKNFGNTTEGSPVAVYNWYTPSDINVDGTNYQFPTNYAIIKTPANATGEN